MYVNVKVVKVGGIYIRTKRVPWYGVTEIETGIFLIILPI